MIRPGQIDDRAGLQTALESLFERFEGGYLALATRAGVGQATIHDMVSGKTFPRWGTLQAVLTACGIPSAELAAWRAAHQRAKDSVTATLSGSGRPLTEFTDPFALEVHRSIQADNSDLPLLPAYVWRAHDDRLSTIVDRAAEGTSSIAVLVAGPSTGKTRACWESLSRLREAGWSLWHPIDPTRPDAALKALADVGPHTVVWLNEAQFYLDHPIGEQVAASFRELLRDPTRSPVLILATLWPEHWATLSARPSGNDTHAQARELISGAEIHVPGTFTDDDAHGLAQASALDPRLAAAVSGATDGRITQYLAGVPLLLDRYIHSAPAARALIHAAMDARRLGHGPHLSRDFLADAAPGYLTDTEWDALDDDWLEAAIGYTAQPTNGIPGPLARIRPRAHHSGPPAYRLADYLEHVGRAERDLLPTPTAFWDALLKHAPQADRSALASAAAVRGLYRYSVRLYASIPSAGSFMSTAQILRSADAVEEALEYYTRAADAQADETAIGSAAYMLNDARGTEAALIWLQARGDGGDATAMRYAARLLQQEGRIEEARIWWAQAANAGDSEALMLVARSMRSSGQHERAREIFRRVAQLAAPGAGGHSRRSLFANHAVLLGAQALVEAGDSADALALLLPLDQRSDISILSMTADLIQETKGVDEALAWLDSLDGTGYSMALSLAGRLSNQAGRSDEALAYFLRAGRIGDTMHCVYAFENAATLLQGRGQLDEAMECYQLAADLSIRLGESYLSPVEQATKMLCADGRLEEALEWLTVRAESGDGSAIAIVATTLRDQGRVGEALALLARWADAGSVRAIREAAWMLWKAGRVAETIAWIEARSAHVDAYALWEMSEMLGEAGHLDQALAYCERACHGGSNLALNTLGRLLAAAGRTAEARRLRRYGREPDGRISMPWTTAENTLPDVDNAELLPPATPPKPFRVTPRPSDILEAMMKRTQAAENGQ